MTEQKAQAIRLTVLATEAELEEISERIQRVLCPDPEHKGPCANPWTMSSFALDDLDPSERAEWEFDIEELEQQREAETR